MQGLIDYKTAKKIINKYPNADEYIIDRVMDLKIKESLYFQPNRDDHTSKGIITRTF